MNQNNIKKDLYKKKPIANLLYIRKGNIIYNTFVDGIVGSYIVVFSVPVEDIGDADFLPQMPAQQLIRWIKTD